MWNIKKIVKKGDYDYALVEDHPNATKNGYVLHHRIVMENHLGRLLTKDEIVHHIDKVKKHNHILNLEVLNPSSHSIHHGSEKGRKWLVLLCPTCSCEFHRQENQVKGKRISASYCSHSCAGKMSAMIKHNTLTPEMKSAISVNIVREYVKYSTDNTEGT